MKTLAILAMTAAVIPEPAPMVLDAKAQMELAQYIHSVHQERDKAQEEAVYWYQMWKNKKGVCI